VRRKPARGSYERDDIYQIVDDGLICHVGFVVDGQPYVIPTLHARDGDTLLLHGSSGSRLMRHAAEGHPLCVTVTHIDAIVLARAVFNHSINYRSAVLFGSAALISDPGAKMDALTRFTERLIPGRWDDARLPNRKEMLATSVVAMPIASASAKVRTGMPSDEPEDLGLPVWGGLIPIRQIVDLPLPDEHVPVGFALPGYLNAFVQSRSIAEPLIVAD
jgi:nitroimidazol reductase NimA-like FMN-containing flavoprotein (pyridoxamine 5'-phosphate oxidase superfamily)